MNKENFIDLMIDNLKAGSTISFNQFMFRNILSVENLVYADWIHLLQRIKNVSLALYTFLPFTYKFIGINLIDIFFSIEGISEEVKIYVQDSLDGSYNFLCLSGMDLSLLKNYDGLFERLINLNDKLVKEGATPVDKILFIGIEPPKLIKLSELV